VLQRLVNLWKGRVRVRVESGFPERVINLCAARQIAFWDLVWESPVSFTFVMTRSDFLRLKKAAPQLNAAFHVAREEGVPFFLRRFRRRYVLLAGLALSAVLFAFGSFFIWDFEIEGNVTLREEEILRALEKFDVDIGTFGYGIQSEQLRNDMLLELPQLSYIAVNVRGCRAHVQVRERVLPPELISKRQSGNTVAARDGLITAVEPYDGKKAVLPGTTVQRGQLLITGVTEDAQAGTRFLRGMGKVYARTWYTLRCRVPLTVEEKVFTGRERCRIALCWGEQRINLWGSAKGENWEKTVRHIPLCLPGDLVLPVTLVVERAVEYTLRERQRTESEAQLFAQRTLEAYLLSQVEGEVLERSVTAVPWEGDLLVQLNAACHEQIGVFVPIESEYESE